MACASAHTRLALPSEAAGDTLLLVPGGRVGRFVQPEAGLPPAVAWHWRSQPLLRLGDATLRGHAVPAGLLLVGTLLLLTRRFASCHVLAALLTAGCALSGLLAPGGLLLAWLLVLLALAQWLLLLPHHAGLRLALCLLMLGLLSQLQLSLGGMESHWLLVYQKTAALQALALSLLLVLWQLLGRWPLLGRNRGRAAAWASATSPSSTASTTSTTSAASAASGASAALVRGPLLPHLRLAEAGLLVLAGLALLGMLLEVLYGGETGVFGVQPVELAKTALVALSAHVLALGADRAVSRRHWWLRLLWPVPLVATLVALALVWVSDFSPLLLLLLWFGLGALIFCWYTGRWVGLGMLGLIAVSGIGLLLALRWGHGTLPAQFYPERFSVWLNPALHPHTGGQFLLAASAIAQGGWFGSDGLLGLATLGQPLGSVMHIPEIADDFAAAFFLQRHGLLGGLLLWLLQALFLLWLFGQSRRAWLHASVLRDYRLAWHARFYAMVLVGGAAFLFGHLFIAWGTSLGMLPVMGQPMSFLSTGGSHLLFFLLPLLGFATLYAPSFEEK